jgi:ATP-binding cassette, subfamily A (ABC1), member 3
MGMCPARNTGKTTAMSVVCGEQLPTDGAAFLTGLNAGSASNAEAIHGMMGYCPQFDALFDNLTAREHLEL